MNRRQSLQSSMFWWSTFWCAVIFIVFTVLFMITFSRDNLEAYKRVMRLEMATLLGQGVDQLAQSDTSGSWDRYVAVTDSVIRLTDSSGNVLFQIGSPLFTDNRIQHIVAALPPQPTNVPWNQLNWSYPYRWRDASGTHQVVAVTEGVTFLSGSRGELELFSLTDPLRQERDRILSILVGVDAFVFALYVLGMNVLLRRGFQPLTRLMEAIRAVEWKRSDRIQLVSLPPELASLQSSVNQLLERIDKSVQEQNRFIADASHELRTPLAIVAGHANLLRRWGNQNQRVWEPAVRNIVWEVERLQKLVNQLLTMARMEVSVPTTQIPGLSVADIRALFVQLEEDTQLLRSDIHLFMSVDVPVDMRAYILADHLRQIFVGLLDNAMRHTQEGGHIQLSAVAQGDMVRFAVTDNGEGIPADVLPNVFDRFYRADSTRAISRGSGLGLSIGKQLVESYGGSIEALSKVGEGTTILFFIPNHPSDTPSTVQRTSL